MNHGVVTFGAMRGAATWSERDDRCLVVQFVGDLPHRERFLLETYHSQKEPFAVRIPGRSDCLVTLAEFDAERRVYVLAMS